eukprot:5081994-Lingulodinium_polyedra.AAC.1
MAAFLHSFVYPWALLQLPCLYECEKVGAARLLHLGALLQLPVPWECKNLGAVRHCYSCHAYGRE